MSLPVSQYEALLAEVRGLRRKAQRVQQLATPLLSNNCGADVNPPLPGLREQDDEVRFRRATMESSLLAGSNVEGGATSSEEECGARSASSEPTLYHGTWPLERTMWNSEPTRVPYTNSSNQHLEVTSVMSFASSSGGALLASPTMSRRSSQQLEAKVDMVYSLLAMLSGQEHADMGETLLALSTSPESCAAMRQSGCIPLLVQMVQSDREPEARAKAAQALHNLVHAQPDEKLRKREVRVLKLLQHARGYTEALRGRGEFEADVVTSSSTEDDDRHPVQTVAHLMKLSFDELHRQAICTLGGIHAIANLVEAEHANHGSTADEQHCVLMRRYACMALTNLTFGDSGNKALLCSFREFMRALVVQLRSASDELRQVTASVLRNLSWRADSSSKEILREVGSVTGLMKAAMLDNRENTLKSILSALWNLSAHCTENKSEICAVDGALGFLVDMLTYKTPSKSLAIIENSGGILRNISSQIAVRDDYREVLRRHNCLQILLDQLKSPSLTIVSNACGTLWNLSAKCCLDQEALWQMGAPTMLRSLNHSKHKMIAMGSSAALKNLLSARPSQPVLPVMDATALAMDLPVLPTLGVRKQKALLQDLDHTLSETYENIDKDSPVKASAEFVHRNKYSDYETDFSSLTLEEPSTSYDSRTASRRFVKPTSRVATEDGDKGFVCGDSGLQSLDIDSGSSSSIDNDKCRRASKSKEVSVCSDEKDRCSIEDVSDSDNNQSSFEQRVQDESSLLIGGLVARREPTSTSLMTSLPLTTFKSSNVTMFEGDIDEIGVDDISIHFDAKPDEDGAEKIDLETEKKSQRQGVKSSGIPLPRSFPRAIQPETKKKSALPRRSLQTSTPIKISGNPSRGEGPSEACNVQTPDAPECSKSPDGSTSDSVDEEYSYLSPETRDRLLERSCEDINPVDNRMLDPDAMIESLERFTAELVSQASHLQSKDNTWNDDTAPNEVTFPSISGSAPNVITFGSSESSSVPHSEEEKLKEPKSNDFSSMGTSTMTESTLIEIEAKKMATVFRNEAEMSHSITSVASLELDKVPPPSLLESVGSDPSRSPKLAPPRRKSLPKGLMVRRALTNSLHNGSSLDSLSNLDLVNPPSALGDVLDLDGSITSVASLPSEGAEFAINGSVNRNNFKPNVSSLFANCSLVSDLDNVNPPSLFNEITDLCNSLADVPTEAIASETEPFEDCRTHVLQTEDDEFSDANSATPIQSDPSSAETSPKKNKSIATLMTSKQRRNLARERYKTYTVAAGLVMKEEEVHESAIDTQSSKMTPKERRQSDRARFETRVVEEAVTELSQQPVVSSPRTKLSIRRNFIQKRLENRDRFKTQVLTPDPTEGDLHLMVEREANVVLNSLKETKTTATDDLLECETLSLVSNEDDSEQNSCINYRTYHKSWGLNNVNKNIPVIQDVKPAIKPKIVKPAAKPQPPQEEETEDKKGIRGRRKPLYAKSIKPIKSVTSNLVKNVTSSIKSAKPASKPPTPRAVGTKPKPPERQGTFTKEDAAPKSRIPTPGASKPRSAPPASKPTRMAYARSTSADSTNRRMPNSTSSHSLKAKRTTIPTPGQRSSSNSSLNGTSAKKQVTSKIASLWKKIEETKAKPAKKDTRVWIQGQSGENNNGVTMREKRSERDDGKRVSRLGSFIVMDDAEGGAAN